jgi:hypothetical protein
MNVILLNLTSPNFLMDCIQLGRGWPWWLVIVIVVGACDEWWCVLASVGGHPSPPKNSIEKGL